MHCSNQHHKPNSNQELKKNIFHSITECLFGYWFQLLMFLVIRYDSFDNSIFDFSILTTQLYIRYTHLCILSVKFTFWTYSMSNATFELIQSNILFCKMKTRNFFCFTFFERCFIYPKQLFLSGHNSVSLVSV